MEKNNYSSNDEHNDNKTLTPRTLLKFLLVICFILAFCPAFIVSCGNEDYNVNVITAIEGVSGYGSTQVEPHPIAAICILVPLISIALLFLKKVEGKKAALVICIGTIIDIIIWFIFRSTVKQIVQEQYLAYKTTAWFYLNIIFLVSIIIITALVISKILNMDGSILSDHPKIKNAIQPEIIAKATGQPSKKLTSTADAISSKVAKIAGNVGSTISDRVKTKNVIGYCIKCGSQIEKGQRFCSYCGEKISDHLLEDSVKEEVERKETFDIKENSFDKTDVIPESLKCPSCNTEITKDAEFCTECGTKIE